MQEKVNRITSLIEKHLEEQLSQTEQQELNEWLAEAESNRMFFQQITDKEILREKMKLYAGADSAAMWHKTLQKMDGGKLVTMYPQRSSFRKYAAAAAAILLVSAGTWFYMGQQSNKELAQNGSSDATIKTAIMPGGNKATLTLADGKTIVLATAGNGMLTKQGATQINKIDGRLIYNREQNDAHQDIDNAYNTVTTPRGGEYQVTLPDGSKVWLNAASSLRFPIVFAGNERLVELTGEAYFEVNPQTAATAANKATKKPFIVKLTSPTGASSEVQVLGTHFNVMAYEDEAAIKTTLLEGAVKVSSGNSSKTIKPGEQAMLNKGDISVKTVDGDDVVAWMNGFIPVGGTDLDFTMRQIGRWYDVQIEYEGNIPNVVFEGKLPRTASIIDVIKVLNANNIKARLDEKGRKIVVTS
jgi:ferric-dicitrate binding protein FerR (iron transport regulator)